MCTVSTFHSFICEDCCFATSSKSHRFLSLPVVAVSMVNYHGSCLELISRYNLIPAMARTCIATLFCDSAKAPASEKLQNRDQQV